MSSVCAVCVYVCAVCAVCVCVCVCLHVYLVQYQYMYLEVLVSSIADRNTCPLLVDQLDFWISRFLEGIGTSSACTVTADELQNSYLVVYKQLYSPTAPIASVSEKERKKTVYACETG